MENVLRVAPLNGKSTTLTIGLAMEQGRATVVDMDTGPNSGRMPPPWLMPSRPSEILNAKTAVPNSVYCVWSGEDEERVLVALFFNSDNARKFAETEIRKYCYEPAPFPSPLPVVVWNQVDESYWVSSTDWQLLGETWSIEKRVVQ